MVYEVSIILRRGNAGLKGMCLFYFDKYCQVTFYKIALIYIFPNCVTKRIIFLHPLPMQFSSLPVGRQKIVFCCHFNLYLFNYKRN